MMLGRSLENYAVTHPAAASEDVAALAVHDLKVPAALHGVSLDLHAGEVLGVAGLIGSGRSELLRALGGITPRSGGDVRINGKPAPLNSADEAQRLGIFFLPEDRKIEGIFPDLSVLENLLISVAPANGGTSGLFLKRDDERQQYERVRQALAIRAQSSSQLISSLSGGNQQKVLLGRALVSRLAHPAAQRADARCRRRHEGRDPRAHSQAGAGRTRRSGQLIRRAGARARQRPLPRARQGTGDGTAEWRANHGGQHSGRGHRPYGPHIRVREEQ